MTNTAIKSANHFFADACDGAGFMQAATIIPAIAGAKTPGISIKEPGSSGEAKIVTHEITKANMKNQIRDVF